MLMLQLKLFYKQESKWVETTLLGKTLNELVELSFLYDKAEMMEKSRQTGHLFLTVL